MFEDGGKDLENSWVTRWFIILNVNECWDTLMVFAFELFGCDYKGSGNDGV